MDEDSASARKGQPGGDALAGEGDGGVPSVGTEFDSIEEARSFYHRYSGRVGFSVRVCNTKLKDGVVTHKKYCCSRQGFRQPDRRDDSVVFHRAETRCGCGAHFAVKMVMNGKYMTYKFEPNHNHELVSPKDVHFLRSHRKSFHAQKVEGEKAAVENMEPTDCSSEDGESLIDEEDDNENQGIVIETMKRPSGTDDSVRNTDSQMFSYSNVLQRGVNMKGGSEVSKTKKPRNTPQPGPTRTPREPELRPQVEFRVVPLQTALPSVPRLQPQVPYQSNAEITPNTRHMFQLQPQVIYRPASLNLNNLPPQLASHVYPRPRHTPATPAEFEFNQIGGPYCYNQVMQEPLLVPIYQDHALSNPLLQESRIHAYKSVPESSPKFEHDPSRTVPK
ncbi:hypothetical protein Taro_020343 [Colocasia esculenta]|uniref:FAR1 domain-containing protein n=1 Tax=Colocasia esculenta TaxID=4460 RepID=A0A843V860_COLES|nr:hypothetical protein [Colocasia esculenta]